MHYWLWTSREAWFIKGRRKHFVLYFQTNLQSYTTNLSNNSSIHKFQICHPNTDSMQYWPLSIRGGHSLPCQGLHKLLWIKPRQVCISVHLPPLSFCALSANTRVLYQLSLHCHTPPSASKECSSSSSARLCHVTASFWFNFSLSISLLDPTPPPSNTPSPFCIYHTTEQILNSPDPSGSLSLFFLMWTIFKVFNLLQYCFCCVRVLVFWPWGMWDLNSQTRDQTHTLCTGKRSLNHWTSEEVSSVPLFLDVLWFALDS